MATKTRIDGREGLRVRLANGPEAAPQARRALSKLRSDLDPPLMETLRLLVTELVTNSVRHGAADSLVLRVAVGEFSVVAEVSDDGPGFDADTAERAGDRDTGWGLLLVQRLAESWGASHDDDGSTNRVWFELRRA
jgi:signal transduction histidine kinase